jgi:hypothetical protein
MCSELHLGGTLVHKRSVYAAGRDTSFYPTYRGFSLALLARPPATFVRPCRGENKDIRISCSILRAFHTSSQSLVLIRVVRVFSGSILL